MNVIDDVRLAIRGFRKTPGVTAVIVLALGHNPALERPAAQPVGTR